MAISSLPLEIIKTMQSWSADLLAVLLEIQKWRLRETENGMMKAIFRTAKSSCMDIHL